MKDNVLGTWYTLGILSSGPVSDSPPPRACFVPSRAIEVVGDWKAAKIGQAVPTDRLPYVPPEGDLLRLAIESFPLKTVAFRRWLLAPEPTVQVARHRALEAWERIE